MLSSACTEKMGLEHGQDIAQGNGAVNIVAASNIELRTDGLWKRSSVPLCTTRSHIRLGDIAPHINLELEWK